jgi:(1->4)-alpha-D-glucan 1-alpha-D-glucosylmutase
LSAEALAAFRDRIVAYMEKATREAKVHTSWVNPNEEYDEATRRFVAGILDPRRSSRFLADLAAFSRRIAFFGRFNSLTQTLIRLTAPGVPDLYQGCELWDLSLVDPDNRRPVDFGLCARLLEELERAAAADLPGLARELLATAEDGRIKLHLIRCALALRRTRPELFLAGSYTPLTATGQAADHVLAFARSHGDAEIVVVAPRLTARLADGQERPPVGELWGECWLQLPHAPVGAGYLDRLSGAHLTVATRNGTPGTAMSDTLASFPVALLERQ